MSQQPTTWKEIIHDLQGNGFIMSDDSPIAYEEMTYSDYFKAEYLNQSISYIKYMYVIQMDEKLDFNTELLKGNLFLIEGEIIHCDKLPCTHRNIVKTFKTTEDIYYYRKDDGTLREEKQHIIEADCIFWECRNCGKKVEGEDFE